MGDLEELSEAIEDIRDIYREHLELRVETPEGKRVVIRNWNVFIEDGVLKVIFFTEEE